MHKRRTRPGRICAAYGSHAVPQKEATVRPLTPTRTEPLTFLQRQDRPHVKSSRSHLPTQSPKIKPLPLPIDYPVFAASGAAPK